MAYIPAVQIESMSENEDANNVEEPTISLHLDEDLPELNNENTSSIVVSDEQLNSHSSDNVDSNSRISDSNDNNSENKKSSSTDASAPSTVNNELGLYKIARLIKNKRDLKKNQKAVVKAKELHKSAKSPTKSRFFKSGLEKVFNKYKKPSETASSTKPKVPPRSLFTLFKNRKSQRNASQVERDKRSFVDHKSYHVRATSPTTTNQSVSVQTEDSWAKEELFRAHQSNRLLREENRLLSESLSYFMFSSSVDSQINHCSSPLQSSNKNTFNTGYHDYFSSSNSNNWNPRSRISRSKSVQEHGERRTSLRNNYRTRSMNCHNVRNKFLLPDPKPHQPIYNNQPDGYNVPPIRRKSVLSNLPVNNSVRSIQRRSSMPERIRSKNDSYFY